MTEDEPAKLGVAILSLLAERDMHPYEMIQTLRERKEDQWVKVSTGSLYHKVERLAEAGFAEAVSTEQQGNRPPRTTYRITPRGQSLLTDWIAEHLIELENPYLAFSLALAELGSLPPERVSELLRTRLERSDEAIHETQENLERAAVQNAERVWMLAHEHRLITLTSERDYIASLVHDIDTKELVWPSTP